MVSQQSTGDIGPIFLWAASFRIESQTAGGSRKARWHGSLSRGTRAVAQNEDAHANEAASLTGDKAQPAPALTPAQTRKLRRMGDLEWL